MALPKVGDGQQASDGNLNEVVNLGRAGQPVQIGGTNTATVGLFGATPAVQPTSSNQAAPASTAPVSISATQWGFTTSTQAQAILTLVTQIRADLVTLGILKGS